MTNRDRYHGGLPHASKQGFKPDECPECDRLQREAGNYNAVHCAPCDAKYKALLAEIDRGRPCLVCGEPDPDHVPGCMVAP